MELSTQAREQGLSVRVIYVAVAALRRKGALPPPRVAPPIPADASAVCSLHVGATRIQCRQWPPAAWLASIAGVSSDAAPERD